MKILLINGWGGLLEALRPLQLSLEKYGYEVDVMDYINVFDPIIVEGNIELLNAYDVIAGWSLGGQVATVLIYEYYKKYPDSDLKILWTLFSNPCFIVHKNWKYAQMEYEFFDFKKSFVEKPKKALSYFLRNILPKDNHRYLYNLCVEIQNQYFEQDKAYQHLLMGLDLLRDLNNLNRLKALDERGIQHICFLAENDDLAPRHLSTPLMLFGSNFGLKLEWLGFEHHFSVNTQATEIANRFVFCLQEKI